MMVEEPSVVAAASYGAKLINRTGGFKTIISERLMIGQIVFDNVKDTASLATLIKQLESQIKAIADESYPSMIARGVAIADLILILSSRWILVFKIFVDTKDAMGANMLNTILEGITNYLKHEFQNMIS